MCNYAAPSMKWPWTSGAWGLWDNYRLCVFICACVCLSICMFVCVRINDHMSSCVFVWVHRFVYSVCVCSKPLRQLLPVFVRMCVYVSVCVCVWLNTCVCMSVLVLVLGLVLVLVLVPEAPWTIIAKQLIAALMVSWTQSKSSLPQKWTFVGSGEINGGFFVILLPLTFLGQQIEVHFRPQSTVLPNRKPIFYSERKSEHLLFFAFALAPFLIFEAHMNRDKTYFCFCHHRNWITQIGGKVSVMQCRVAGHKTSIM